MNDKKNKKTAHAALLSECLESLRKLILSYSKKDSAKTLHDLRVASRRLRTYSNACSPFIKRQNLRSMKKISKTALEFSSELRNLDVFSAWTLKRLDSEDQRKMVEDFIEELRRPIRAKFIKRIKSPRFHKRLQFNENSLSTASVKALLICANSAAKARAMALKKACEAYETKPAPETLHAARICIKKYKYSIEALAAFSPPSNILKELHAAASSAQELLGQSHDLSVFERIARILPVEPRIKADIDSAIRSSQSRLSKKIPASLKELSMNFKKTAGNRRHDLL